MAFECYLLRFITVNRLFHSFISFNFFLLTFRKRLIDGVFLYECAYAVFLPRAINVLRKIVAA